MNSEFIISERLPLSFPHEQSSSTSIRARKPCKFIGYDNLYFAYTT